MTSISQGANSISTDIKDLASLRESAKNNAPEALRETAKKFEAMFVNMILKSMRDATPKEGPFDSEQSKMFTSMLDQELSQSMAQRGIGLADVLVRQLSSEKSLGVVDSSSQPGSKQSPPSGGNSPDLSVAPREYISAYAKQTDAKLSSAERVESFREKVGDAVKGASNETGIAENLILAHAALESGWGKREVKNPDGSSSHNFFGIKATPEWKGKVAEVVTTEYLDGKPRKSVERFRSYTSVEEGFSDYARFLKENKRYQNILGASSVDQFATGLQRAGYATDPLYADKLRRVVRMT